jgi:hypothetical protein
LKIVLVEEVESIHGVNKTKEKQISKISGNGADAADKRRILYHKLYGLDSTALCLSGGGIRSAAFALGVIQALAKHTGIAGRGDANSDRAKEPADSLLSQIHYLSTVSGGGYIGSWLSAWISRAGFAAVWRHLTRAAPPDLVESPGLSWLRAYSNYLTPRRGLMSADTWAAAALFFRNMYLNWLVIIPPLCALLIVVKGMALLMFAVHGASVPCVPAREAPAQCAPVQCTPVQCTPAQCASVQCILVQCAPARETTARETSVHEAPICERPPGKAVFFILGFPITWGTLLIFVSGLVALVTGLIFSLRNRPTAIDETAYRRDDAKLLAGKPKRENVIENMPRQRQECDDRYRAKGATDGEFLLKDLLWVFVAALLLVYWIAASLAYIRCWTLSATLLAAAGAGAFAFALAWVLAFQWKIKTKRPVVKLGEFFAGIAAGGISGAAVGLGIQVLLSLKLCDSQIVYILFIAGVPWIIASHLTGVLIFVGLTSREQGSDQDREWFGRSTGWYTAVNFGWLVLTSLVVVGPMLALGASNIDGETWKGWYATATGVIGAISGIVSAVLGHSKATSARGENAKATGFSLDSVLKITVPLFLALLIVGLSAAIDWAWFWRWLFDWRAGPDFATVEGGVRLSSGLALSLLIAGLASFFVNVNWFSLHSLYRNRLIRAFLGASAVIRRPNPFTGFDQEDNPQMAELWPAIRHRLPGGLKARRFSSDDSRQCDSSATDGRERWPKDTDWGPFHIVNVALNLVSSKRLAWQERKAASFTISPLHSGTALDGRKPMFRRTFEYGWPPSRDSTDEVVLSRSGVSLGTAMAISGAAASPNMGYHSSPLVTLVLALFNVRLGWWLGNPGEAGGTWLLNAEFLGRDRRPLPFERPSPQWALGPLCCEVFGKTSEERRFVYLSDGGHFDNLGLYEMVRRRCRYIIVSDATADSEFSFDDLGMTVRKISIDLGVTIRFEGIHALKRIAQSDKEARQTGVDTPAAAVDPDALLYASALIEYGSDKNGNPQHGYLLYVKPIYHTTLVGDIGIRSYAIAHSAFPHESTGDQFFSESQFESYRALAFELMDRILTRGAQTHPDPQRTALANLIEQLYKEAANRGKKARQSVPGRDRGRASIFAHPSAKHPRWRRGRSPG